MLVRNLVHAALLAALAGMLAACTINSTPSLSPLALPSPGISLSALDSPVSTPGPLTTVAADSTPPVAPSEAPITSPACVRPDELPAYIGRETCVHGVVIRTENRGTDFVMWMAEEPQQIYIAVHNTFYLGVEGACLRVTGVVQKDDEGKIFIRADEPGQVSPCDG